MLRWLGTALFTAMAVNSSLPVAEGVAGNSGCTTGGRKPDFRYASQGLRGLTLYGYARVSGREPEDKNLDLQVERLVRAGCAMGNIRAEKAGAKDDRGGLLVLQRRFFDLVSFWPEIASRKARPQGCHGRGQVAMKSVLKVPFLRSVVVILEAGPKSPGWGERFRQ